MKKAMQTIKYEGRIPNSLRTYCDRHRHQIAEVSYGSGYCTNSGMAYDVLLRSGWNDYYNPTCHTIIEDTLKDVLGVLKDVAPCECKECVAEVVNV